MNNSSEGEKNQSLTINEFYDKLYSEVMKGLKYMSDGLNDFNRRLEVLEARQVGINAQFEKVLKTLDEAIDAVPTLNN